MSNIKDEVRAEALSANGSEYKLLRVETMNSCLRRAAEMPIPKMLYSEFWFEGELCVLFANTNTGKSLLAFQIADSISRGQPVKGFKMDAGRQIVLYCDFELSEKQNQCRYSEDYRNTYRFSEGVYRISINPDKFDFDGDFEALLKADIEQAVKTTGAKVVIIDNITWLRTETEKARDALPLMKAMKGLQRVHGVSVLLLAHSPKRNNAIPIGLDDLAGSKHLMNFVDSAFTIGTSFRDSGLRYIKQIKARSCPIVYGTDFVVLCRIEKDVNFTGFHVEGYEVEYKHLKPLPEQEKEVDEARVIEVFKKNPKASLRQIGKELGLHHETVRRILTRVGLIGTGGTSDTVRQVCHPESQAVQEFTGGTGGTLCHSGDSVPQDREPF
ncbi:MAG: AAA family ATPase [Chlorobium sp.]|nr:MAG: LuxR family transcriptional regulator [Chlorobium sp.]